MQTIIANTSIEYHSRGDNSDGFKISAKNKRTKEMAKSYISTTTLISLAIFCMIVIWLFQKRRSKFRNPPFEPDWRRRADWRSQFEGVSDQHKVSFGDCLKSMSMAFLQGGGWNDSVINEMVGSQEYRSEGDPFMRPNRNVHGTHFGDESHNRSQRVDQQGRSYRFGRGGRKIYQRKRLGERIRKVVAASQKWRCHDCDELLTATFEVDHVIPVSQGGSNDLSNLNALCRNCHGERTSRQGIEFNF